MKSQNREVKEESMGGEGGEGGLTDLNVVHRDLSRLACSLVVYDEILPRQRLLYYHYHVS